MITINRILSETDTENRKKLISIRLSELEQNSEQDKELNLNAIHKGYISTSDTIQFSSDLIDINDYPVMSKYTMKATDYFYEFASELKKRQVINRGELVRFIYTFLNQYFGIPKDNLDYRDSIFLDIAFQTTTTDDELFDRLEQNKIGDLKQKNVAMCTERAAMAQNLLSLFDFECYYCNGCMYHNQKEECHCFNIVKTKNDFKLLDYSVPIQIVEANQIIGTEPFLVSIPLEEGEAVLNGEIEKKYPEYYSLKEGTKNRAIPTGEERIYIIGNTSFQKEASPHHKF